MDKSLLYIAEPTPKAEVSLTSNEKHNAKVGKRLRLALSVGVYCVAIPLVIWLGIALWNDRKYNIVSMIIAFLACVPFFVGFEKGKTGTRELVVIAVMTAISVLGRVIFAPIPGFKPVTAIVIITAIAYGAQAGFLTGALSAVVSNIFYGQGPWTPFQMFVWGIIGFIAGILFKRGKKPNVVVLVIVGLVGGVAYSTMMDIWTVLSFGEGWSWTRYLGALSTSLPFMAIYAVSNVVFLLLLTKPFLEKLNRIGTKYNLFGAIDEQK